MITKKGVTQKKESKKVPVPRKIEFIMVAPEAHNVFLSGDFNDWSTRSHPFRKVSDGEWKVSVALLPGRYEYRFLMDGKWQNDPRCAEHAPNSFGSENCVLTVE
jgi:1,4-alpha-glucan branching enzyme